jgi:hypothetical protein
MTDQDKTREEEGGRMAKQTDYKSYCELMSKCTFDRIHEVDPDEVKEVCKIVEKTPSKTGIMKVGTIIIDRAKANVAYELQELNRVIDSFR